MWRKYVLRVISGSAKGHRLKSLEGLSARPTADRVKESLFNILANDIDIRHATILDLFAGTGSLGIEALSRGAKFAIFVERNAEATKIIHENLLHTKLHLYAKIITVDCGDYIRRLPNKSDKFDIIFMDPPYSKELVTPILRLIWEKQLLKKEGVIVIETDKHDSLPEIVEDFVLVRSRKYGRTVISIYK